MSYLSLISDRDPRRADILPVHTVIHSEEGIFTIEDQPVHSGGHGLLYYVHKEGTEIDYVLKEYFPAKGYSRKNGIVVPTAFGDVSSDSMDVLKSVEDGIEESVNTEERNSQLIYRHTSRVAVNRTALHVSSVTYPDGTSFTVPAGMTNPWHFLLIDDLTQKGAFLTDIIREAVYEKSDDHPFGNYTPRRSLGKTLPVLDIHITLKIISSVLELLSRIHERAGYIHGDIQPNNIFFEGADLKKGIVGHAVFLDFGSSHKLQDNNTTELLLPSEVTGTPAFAPPELYNEDCISLTPAADLYSVGRLFLSLIKPKTAISSFGSVASPCLSYNQLRIKPGEERASHCSPALAKSINSILKKALEPDPELRFQSAREMMEAIEALTPRYSLPEGLSTPEFFIEHSRDKELKQLEQALEDGIKPIWIWGFGGLGKTELANEFGRRCKQKSYKVAMFHFHDSIQQTILDLNISGYQYVAPNGLKPEDKPHAEFEDRICVLNGLGRDTVLIMDNFDDENTRLVEMMSSSDFKLLCSITPHIMITTRYSFLSGSNTFEISPLKDTVLLTLFDRDFVNADNKTLLDIIHAVDCHTMTVSIIAKAMSDPFSPLDTSKILKALKHTNLSAISDSIVSDKDREYKERSIYSHLKALFNISSLSLTAHQVLKYSVIIPIGGLDSKFFFACLSEPEKTAFKIIVERGWLTCDKVGLLHIHPLVRELCIKELHPLESDFKHFFFLMKSPSIINQFSNRSRLTRAVSFVQSIYNFSIDGYIIDSYKLSPIWESTFEWEYVSTVLSEYDRFIRDSADYILQQNPSHNNPLRPDFDSLLREEEKCNLVELFKSQSSLSMWLLNYLSLHPQAALSQAEDYIRPDEFRLNQPIFCNALPSSIIAKEQMLHRPNHSELNGGNIEDIYILHELAILGALDPNADFDKISLRFKNVIRYIENLVKKNPTKYFVLLSYEYYNYAHYLACSTEEAIRANADTYYQLALDMQLHVDEHTPCNKSTCITDIVLEYLAYKKTGKVKRGFTEFTLPEVPPPPCKRPIRARDFDNPRDFFKANREWAQYNREIQLHQDAFLKEYLIDHKATPYLLSRLEELPTRDYQLYPSKI